MSIVGRGDARAWGVGITLLVLGIAASAWWLSRGEEPMPVPREDAGAAAEEASNPFDALAPAGSIVRGTDPVPTDVLRLSIQMPEGARACTIRGPEDGLPLEVASCAPVALPAGETVIAMAARDVDVALLHAGDVIVNDLALWRGDAVSAFAGSPSSLIAMLAPDDRTRAIVDVAAGAEPARYEAPAPNGPGSPDLVWSHLFFLERSQDPPNTRTGTGGNDRLFARPAASSEPAVFVGEVPDAIGRIQGCKSDTALAVVADAPAVHGVRRVAATFLDDVSGSWSPPIVADAAVFEYQLSCRGREATMTWLEPGEGAGDSRRIVQIRCTPQGCERAEANATFTGSDPTVGDLAGKVLLVWAARDATHARLAPLTEIDRREGLGALPQPPGPILARRLYFRRGAAVLVYRTQAGLFALRIDAGGRFAPLPVREQTALSAP